MINSVFTDTFNFLINSLNSLNQDSVKGKSEKPNDVLKRLIDTVQFIYTKKIVFNTDLESVKQELIQMQREASRLKTEFSRWTNNSLIFTIESLIHSLILEVNNEIEKREKRKKEAVSEAKAKESAKAKEDAEEREKLRSKEPKNPNAVKVKIFKSAFANVIEKEMNDFLNNNNVEITDKLQSVEKDVICITLFYK
jgi:hypothetical protein